MAKIFVSYSRMQVDWVQNSLVPVLRAGGSEVLIDLARFRAGTSVVGQMDKAQDESDVQLLCMSSDYLTSDYCKHEMDRAISRDPTFTSGLDGRVKRGLVLPIRLDDSSWPSKITEPNPLFADMRASAIGSNSWKLLLDPCQVDLGTPAQSWLAARDEAVRYISRGQSVNLLVQQQGIAWQHLVQDLVMERVPPMALVDLQEPSTNTRHGLLNRILQRLGSRETIRQEPNDLQDFERILSAMERPSRVSICNFDLAPHRKRYGLDLYSSLRWMITHTRQLVLLVQSRTPFNALLPRENPLSNIDIKTVRLG